MQTRTVDLYRVKEEVEAATNRTEKRTPHRKLAVVKAMVAAGKVRTTISALAGGAALGFGFEEIVSVVAVGLLQEHDHARRLPRLAGRLPASDFGREVYLKLIVLDDVPIVSFKEL